MKDRTHSLLSATSRRALSVAYALSGLIALSVFGSDEKPAVDPRADELIKRMGEFLGQAKFFSVNAEVWQDTQLSLASEPRQVATSKYRFAGPIATTPSCAQPATIAS